MEANMIRLPSMEHITKYKRMKDSGKYTEKELDEFWRKGTLFNGKSYSEKDVIKAEIERIKKEEING